MSNIDQGQRDEILAEYDGLISKGKKHKAARQEVISQWKFVHGWNESKIYNLIQSAWRLRNTEKAETTGAEVKAEPVEAETTKTTGTAAAVTVEAEKGVETTVPTLLEREAKVQKALESIQEASWEWAFAITEIHDSKCYPGAEEKDGSAAYMLARWNIRRAQAYRAMAWVNHEISLTLVPMLPEESQDKSQYPAGYSGSQEQQA